MYNVTNSNIKPFQFEVPQGSTLGPLFFMLFMNDFSRTSEVPCTVLLLMTQELSFSSQNIQTNIDAYGLW